MLIRFKVANFWSFRDEVEFSMVAGTTTDHPDHITEIGEESDDRILRTGIVYGANAAGKSNLIKALQFARDFIVFHPDSNNRISAIPFMLNSRSEVAPSKFEFEIECESGTYIYGFEVDSDEVHSEYLVIASHDGLSTAYERGIGADGNQEVWLKEIPTGNSQDRRILEATRVIVDPRELFLSALARTRFKYLKDVYDWFRYSLKIIMPDVTAFLTKSYISDVDFERNFPRLLQLMDLDIADVSLRELSDHASSDYIEELLLTHGEDERDVALHIPQEGTYLFVRADKHVRMKQLFTIHNQKGKSDRQTFYPIQESDGTRRLFDLSWAFMDLFSGNEDQVLVIDELDLRLHPEMTRHILEIFLQNSVGKRSQLIATTHEAGLLDLDLLRRDEIWFVEKDNDGNSTVYSLDEFVPQFGKDIRSAYLQGRFGAIPIVPSYNILEWAKTSGQA